MAARKPAAKPRFATRPTPGGPIDQVSLWRSAEALSTPMLPWQKQASRLLGELLPSMCRCHEPARPLPRYKTVVVSVPRQQGKTVLARSAVKARAEAEADMDIYGTAQTRQYAAKHVVELGRKLRRVEPGIKVTAGVGAERITWANGSRYQPISPTEGGGHGDSIDFMLIDEGWALTAVTLGGIAPALTARPHSQTLIISTMGTVESTAWNGIVAQGREAVAAQADGIPTQMAYIEYSAPTDEAVWQPELWHSWMPALGLTVSPDDINAAIALMEAAEGRAEVIRAFGNRTVAALVQLFPAEWVTRAWRSIQPGARVVLGVDVNDEPMGASISAAHITDSGLGAIRTISNAPGSPRWVPQLIEQILSERKVEAVVADLGAPVKQLQTELEAICERKGVPLVNRMPREMGADCLRFYHHLRDELVVLNAEPDPSPLGEAIAHARRKDLGDLWVVTRRGMPVDASPLIAGIIAYGVAVELNVRPPGEIFIY
jgi:hypothetical protein